MAAIAQIPELNLATLSAKAHWKDMTKNPTGKAAIAGAIGSAAVTAALLYANRKKNKEAVRPAKVPGGEPPETD